MVAHAFYKALLFLGAGSVIHGLHDEQNMKRMGALRKYLPVTWVTFIIGWLAIAGVPPFAGFWSKDDVLANAFEKSPALWAVGLVTAVLTAYYMTRQVILVFWGEPRWGNDEGHEVHPHEAPPTMTIPLVVLAAASVLGGLINLPWVHTLEHFLEPAFRGGAVELHMSTQTQVVLTALATLAAGLGIALARAAWSKTADRPELEPAILERAWGVDDAVSALVGGPGAEFAEFTAYTVDKKVVDGAYNGLAGGVRRGGDALRKVQTGYVRNYALGIAAGTVRPARLRDRPRRSRRLMHPVHAGFPLLTAIVVVPVVGALLVSLIPRTRTEIVRVVALVAAVVTAALTVLLAVEFKVGDAGFQLVSRHVWIKQFGISWKLGVDGISLWLVVLTGVLFPIALLGSKVSRDVKPYFAWMLVLEAGCLGTFLALDLFLFFLFFEIVLVPMYFLIGGWGYDNRVYAALKFFLFTLAGSAFMLVGMLALVFLHQRATGVLTFDLVALAEKQALAESTARWVFLAFAMAFAVKVPLFPVHTWLPDAHTEAPTAGSVILAGVLLKMGTYGLLRFGLYLFPKAAVDLAPILLTLAVIGITYGAIVATMQKDLKRLVAYSSIAHLGFIVLGTFAFTTQGLSGSVLQMVNHGLSTGALFLLVGMIYERRHTRQIAELGGLQKAAPVLAAAFMVVMLSSVGLPGLNGFVGEFLILLGTFVTHRWWAVAATSGVILAAVYLLWAYQRVFHGEPEGENATMPDLTLRERAVMVPLIAMIVVLGVYPKPVLDRINPSVAALLDHVENTRTNDTEGER